MKERHDFSSREPTLDCDLETGPDRVGGPRDIGAEFPADYGRAQGRVNFGGDAQSMMEADCRF